MEAYKSRQDSEFSTALQVELARIRTAIAGSDESLVKAESDRLKLVQALDPVTLKLSTWPFDRASLIKYGVTPLVSLAAAYGKTAIESLWKH
jgi:hypothetical protein